MIDWTWGDINNGDVAPGAFSWFHLLWIGIMIIACVDIGLTVVRKHSQNADRIVLSLFSVILIGCEVFKQLFGFAFYRWFFGHVSSPCGALYLLCTDVASRDALAYRTCGYGRISHHFAEWNSHCKDPKALLSDSFRSGE